MTSEQRDDSAVHCHSAQALRVASFKKSEGIWKAQPRYLIRNAPGSPLLPGAADMETTRQLNGWRRRQQQGNSVARIPPARFSPALRYLRAAILPNKKIQGCHDFCRVTISFCLRYLNSVDDIRPACCARDSNAQSCGRSSGLPHTRE